MSAQDIVNSKHDSADMASTLHVAQYLHSLRGLFSEPYAADTEQDSAQHSIVQPGAEHVLQQNIRGVKHREQPGKPYAITGLYIE